MIPNPGCVKIQVVSKNIKGCQIIYKIKLFLIHFKLQKYTEQNSYWKSWTQMFSVTISKWTRKKLSSQNYYRAIFSLFKCSVVEFLKWGFQKWWWIMLTFSGGHACFKHVFVTLLLFLLITLQKISIQCLLYYYCCW